MEEKKHLIIGSRGSKLALWQSNWVKAQLEELGHTAEITIIKTQGDKIQHLSFDKIEGKGFFTKEIEQELIDGTVDFAVHSMKDMPTTSENGLCISATSSRVDPRDTLVIRKESLDGEGPLPLKKGAIIGTSSIRRKIQLLSLLPEIEIKDIRGNVPTRLDKLRSGDFDAIVLAAAGIERLEIDLSEFRVFNFDPLEFVPAPAQGVLAYQCRADDAPVRRVLKKIHDGAAAELTNIERKVLKIMDGGCQVPLGVYCKKDELGNFHVLGAYATDGVESLRKVHLSQSTSIDLAEKVVEQLTKDI